MTGTIGRERIRKNFKTELEAQTFINGKLAGRITEHTPRALTTSLEEATLRRAEAAVMRLPKGTDILQAVDFFAEHHRPLRPLEISVAIERFGEWLTTQRKNEAVTVDQRKVVLTQFARAAKISRTDRISTAPADDGTPSPVAAWIYSAAVNTRTQRDRFDLLNWFCGYLKDKKHAATNPIADLDRPVHRARVPGVFTFDETWRLLHCALTDAEGPDMLPFFAICVLSGVRPDEIPRLGTKKTDGSRTSGWEDIYLEEEHRFIEVNKAKGGRRRRNATIPDPLFRILSWGKAHKLRANFFSKRKFNRIRRRAGLYGRWEKDVLRHTYASHHYIVHKDVKQLESDMGNSERVLFQSYIRPVSKADGIRMSGLCLHYSAPREKSAAGSGPKPRARAAV